MVYTIENAHRADFLRANIEKTVGSYNNKNALQRLAGRCIDREQQSYQRLLFLTSPVAVAEASLFLGFGFVDNQVSLHVGEVVEHLDGFGGFIQIAHFDKTETLGASGNFVDDDFGGINGAGLAEKIGQRLFVRFVRKITNVQFAGIHRNSPKKGLETWE